MLNRKLPFGTIGGTHEFNAAFEQHGRLFDIHGYEIDKNNGTRLEGPESPGWKGPQQKGVPTKDPTVHPPLALLDQLILQYGSRDAAIVALQQIDPAQPAKLAPAPVGLSMQALNNPPLPDPDPQAGEYDPDAADPDANAGEQGDEEEASPADIIDDGINLSAWARGELPQIEFMRVKPLVKKLFDKTPVNASMAVAIINKGLPEQ